MPLTDARDFLGSSVEKQNAILRDLTLSEVKTLLRRIEIEDERRADPECPDRSAGDKWPQTDTHRGFFLSQLHVESIIAHWVDKRTLVNGELSESRIDRRLRLIKEEREERRRAREERDNIWSREVKEEREERRLKREERDNKLSREKAERAVLREARILKNQMFKDESYALHQAYLSAIENASSQAERKQIWKDYVDSCQTRRREHYGSHPLE